MKNELKFTGERVLPYPSSDLYETSLARYKFASRFINKEDQVLDIACGSGYGSEYLSNGAKSVCGTDIDAGTIDYCRTRYKKTNLLFFVADEDFKKNYRNKFDVVVSMETIEHVKNYDSFLSDLKDYLKPAGVLIMSTPNNYKFINPPTNKFHIREFEIKELYYILKKYFSDKDIDVYGQQATNDNYGDMPVPDPFLKKLIKYVFKHIYVWDKKTVNILGKIEHWSIYKRLGRMQKNNSFNPAIFQIDINNSFINPEISIFVIK